MKLLFPLKYLALRNDLPKHAPAHDARDLPGLYNSSVWRLRTDHRCSRMDKYPGRFRVACVPVLAVLILIADTQRPALAAPTSEDEQATMNEMHTAPKIITGQWRLITDQVMGGESTGAIAEQTQHNIACTRLSGSVSTQNNGGFIQMALDLNQRKRFDASKFRGIHLKVSGNGEKYNVHLRTSDLWLPWQSYRADFIAKPGFSDVYLPFDSFQPYRTKRRFRPEHLKRIGLVGIGREFNVDLCLAEADFY